jgi:thiol-disulfide isomerase/thioredoxin
MFRSVLLASLFLVGTSSTIALAADHNFRPYIATRLAKAVMTNPEITSNDEDKSTCDGLGYITHGDGHKTPCTGCSACKKVLEKELSDTKTKLEKALSEIESLEKIISENEKILQSVSLIPVYYNKPFVKTVESQDDETVYDGYPPQYEGDIIVYAFGAKWCAPCKVMKERTWNHPDLKRFMKDNKIRLIQLDSDKLEHFEYFKYYEVRSLPTVLILNKSNLKKPLCKMVGIKSADAVMRILQSELQDG